MKVAIVHDDFIQHGGAERLVLAMLEIYPEADLYAVVASDKWQQEIKKSFNKNIRTTWLQNLPLRDGYFKFYYAFYPLAIESLNFKGYDLVISSSARYAHGLITHPETIHIAYINSPARFLYQEGIAPKNLFMRPVLRWHRAWDLVASKRPDYIIANSKTPAGNSEKYWRRGVDEIIYPFVEIQNNSLENGEKIKAEGNYFLIISRLNKWKRLDIAVEAFTKLNLPLYIIGSGSERRNLEKISGPSIKFLGGVSDSEKLTYLKYCRALIVPQEEDFGIVTLEANACGRPVIAYKGGGSLELISDGVNGLFFSEQQAASLIQALGRFDRTAFNRENCLEAARRFTKNGFKKALADFVQSKMKIRQDY